MKNIRPINSNASSRHFHPTSMDIWSFINRDVPTQTTFKKSTQNENSKNSFCCYRRNEYSNWTCNLFFSKLQYLSIFFDIWLQKWLPNFCSQMQTLHGIWKLLSTVYAMRCACRLYTALLQAFWLIFVNISQHTEHYYQFDCGLKNCFATAYK